MGKENIETLNDLKKEILEYSNKKKLLKKYGFDFKDDEINHIEIVSVNEDKLGLELIFKNNFDGTLWKSHLLTSIQVNHYDKYKSAIEYSITKDNIKEQYWYTRTSDEFNMVNIRNNNDNLFHSRVYADVICKYGNFVIEIAKGKSNTFGKESYIALYHGRTEDIMHWNNFDFAFEGAIKYRYAQGDNHPMVIYQAQPNMWSIDLRRWMYMLPNSNIYAFDIKNKLKGVILEDGTVYEEYMPNLDRNVIKQLISHKQNPQAIFVHCDGKYKNNLSIIKDKNTDKIEIIYERKTTYDRPDMIIESIPIKKDGKLTLEEISNISNCLQQYKSNEFLCNVCNELDIYCNIINHTNNKGENKENDLSNPFILPINDFSKVVTLFRNSNLVELTEKLIENYSKEIGIDISDIVNIYNKDNIEHHKKMIKESHIKNI